MLGDSSSINHALSWDTELGCLLALETRGFLVYSSEDAGRISGSTGKGSEMSRLYHSLQPWYHKRSLPAWGASVEGKTNRNLSATCPHNQVGPLELDPQFLLAGIPWLLSLTFLPEKARRPKGILQKLSAIIFHFGLNTDSF